MKNEDKNLAINLSLFKKKPRLWIAQNLGKMNG